MPRRSLAVLLLVVGLLLHVATAVRPCPPMTGHSGASPGATGCGRRRGSSKASRPHRSSPLAGAVGQRLLRPDGGRGPRLRHRSADRPAGSRAHAVLRLADRPLPVDLCLRLRLQGNPIHGRAAGVGHDRRRSGLCLGHDGAPGLPGRRYRRSVVAEAARHDYQIRVPVWGIAAAPLVEGDLLIVETGGVDDACLMAFDKRPASSGGTPSRMGPATRPR